MASVRIALSPPGPRLYKKENMEIAVAWFVVLGIAAITKSDYDREPKSLE